VAHFAGPAAELWSALGEAGAPGPGLNNTVSAAPVDLAAGLQWAFSGPGCTTIEASWAFTPNSSQPKPYSIWLPEIFHLQFTH
jgi:hypothetical protein